MRFRAAVAMASLAGLLGTAPALCAADPDDGRARAQVGVDFGASASHAFDEEADSISGPFLRGRVSVPFSKRFAVEGLVTLERQSNSFSDRTEGLYTIQVRQRLVRAERKRLKPFVTYGATGYWGHISQAEYTVLGSRGEPHTFPSIHYWEFDEPIASTFGAGADIEISRRVSLRADASLLTLLWFPLNGRVSAGVSFALTK